MENSPTVTLCMIVRNEERYLRDCLDSVTGIVNQIVIVDTGSTDNTLSIANEYNAEVFFFRWINDFSAARNFALKNSTCEWVLYLDADERLSKDSIEKLKKILVTGKKSKTGVKCLVNSIDDKRGKPVLMKYTRLFRNSDSIQFSGKVHEQIEDSLIANSYQIIDSDIEIIHVGYNIESYGLKEKARRNLDLLHSEYAENQSPYYAFQLGNTYLILEDLTNALRYFNIALKDDRLDKAYKAICYLHIADYYCSELYDFKKAESAVFQGLQGEPSNPLLNLLAAQIFYKSGNKEKAISFCREALYYNLQLKTKTENSTILYIVIEQEKIYSYGLYIALIYQDEKALEFFLKEADPLYRKIFFLLLNNSQLSSNETDLIIRSVNNNNLELFLLLFEKSSNKESAQKILLALKDNFPENPKLMITLGNLFVCNKSADDGINFFKESLNLRYKDPSAVFYLISALVGQNRLTEIPEWLLFAENEFGHIPLLNEKISILKQKLEVLAR